MTQPIANMYELRNATVLSQYGLNHRLCDLGHTKVETDDDVLSQC